MTTPATPEGVRTVSRRVAQTADALPAPADQIYLPAGYANPDPPALADEAADPEAAAAGGTTATAQAAALAVAVSRPAIAAGLSGPPPTPRIPGGTLYQSRRGDGAGPGGGRRGGYGLPALRVGVHAATPAGLAQLDAATPAPAGLLLGVDQDALPVPLTLFRPEPTRIAMVGGDWRVRVVVFRALALGARVSVVTSEPTPWRGFGEWATGRTDRLTVLPLDADVDPTATSTSPTLVVRDVGPVGGVGRFEPGPWQAHLVVLRGMIPQAQAALANAELALLGRLDATEAELPDMVMAVSAATVRFVWMRPTVIERTHLGAPTPQ
jgi:hypothetical protein